MSWTFPLGSFKLAGGPMSLPNQKTIHYPESDGRPMGETDQHRDAMIRIIELLMILFRGQQLR